MSNQKPETRNQRKPNFTWLLATGIWLLFLGRSAYACPLCKEAISRMEEIWFAVGLNLSIYIMITIPFLLVGSFALALYLNYRKRGGK